MPVIDERWPEKGRIIDLETTVRNLRAKLSATEWRLIETAIDAADDGWIPRSLFAIKREWGWEMWVGQCDAGDIWLGRTDDGSCFHTEQPTHWMPLPEPPK